MMLKKVCILSSVIVVVFLAGCAKEVSVATAGVVIEKFTPQVSTVASNSPVELTLIVKNVGEREAKDVKAVLGGLTFLPDLVTDETEKQKYWKLDSEKVLKNLDPSSLLGEDTESGFRSDQSIATWRLTAPIQARDQSYEPTVNLVYTYSTISTILIKAVNFDYFQSLSESEQASIDTGIIVSKTTKGPIEISVKSDQAVISGSSTLPIEIEFKNVGGGRTFFGGESETDPTRLYDSIKNGLDKISVDLPDMQCNLKPDPTTKKYEVRLIEGKNGRILCNKVIGGISTIQTFSMDIKTEYRYVIEGKTTVKVSKTLYQPPIVDISLDVIPSKIEHTHGGATTAELDVRVTNVGNQIVDISSLIADIAIVGDIRHEVEFSKSSLQPFDYESKNIKLEPTEKEILIASGKVGTVTNEKNTENNKFTNKRIPLDYDISIEKVIASIDDINKLSVKITASIDNIGTNVIGKNIPVEFKIDNTKIDCPTKEIPELKPDDTPKDISCIWDNPDKKLKFKITVSVPYSQQLEKTDANNKKDYDFEAKYDISLESASFDEKTSKLVATVKNTGTIKAENVYVEFYDQDKNLLCDTQDNSITLEGGRSDKIECKPFLDLTKKYTVTAYVIGLDTEPDKTNNNNEKSLFAISPWSLSLSSVAGDTTVPYWDTSDDKQTEVVLSVKGLQACRWGRSDVVYSSMDSSNECIISGSTATCSLGSLSLSKEYKRYISCKDVVSVEQKITDNLDILFGVDWTPPTVGRAEIYSGTIYTDGTNYWYKGTISIRASTFDDESGVPLGGCKYTVDGSTWPSAIYDSTNKYCKIDSLSPTTDITINFRATNGADLTTTGIGRSYKYDGTAPTTSLSAIAVVTSRPPYTPGTWTAAEGLEVTLACQDTGSGCTATPIKYCIDKPGATSACTPGIAYSQTFQITTSEYFEEGDLLRLTSEGVAYLRYASADNLGNTETKVAEIKIDNTAPDVSGATVASPGTGCYYQNSPSLTATNFFRGNANDKYSYGSGLNKDSTKFYIKRTSDNKYWTGSTWSNDLTRLPTKHSETNGDTSVPWTGDITPRQWEVGTYVVRALVTDKAGNKVTNPVDKSEGGNPIGFRVDPTCL